jgi:3-oxoacyl-[acyl-carrier-protein] synthase-3
MAAHLGLLGLGHALGSSEMKNSEVAESLGLPADWYLQRTGIETRRVCADGEDVLTLAAAAVRNALADADLDAGVLGHETVLMHIQNGFTHLTPPAGVILAGHLGLSGVRVIGFDGVCAEPVAALDLATTMLQAGRCQRVIISAAVDFLSYVDPVDRDTAGLFGAGAGAIILSADSVRMPLTIQGLHWESHAQHWDMGESRVRGVRQCADGVEVLSNYYTMRGQSLYRLFLQLVPPVIGETLRQAGWSREDIGLLISHQPNPRQLELAVRRLSLDPDAMPMPGRRLGNMGPASLLVNLSMARDDGRLERGTKVLLLAFGIGFSCGAVAVEVGEPVDAESVVLGR